MPSATDTPRKSFKDRSFDERFKALGDEAEGAFERVCELSLKRNFARYGLNRPPIQLHKVPAKVRYTPDYMMSEGLVEVQGFGTDQLFKIKLDKLTALCEWDEDWRGLRLFVFDSYHKRWAFLALMDLMLACVGPPSRKVAERGMFPEGKEFWKICAEDLPVDEWRPMP